MGIYRDTVLLGLKAPIAHPLSDGLVTGQDGDTIAPYRGKIYWFRGDTGQLAYPLGNFSTSGATSLLPGKGGLDPSVGVNLNYWVNKDGFSRPMIELPQNGQPTPIWINGLVTVNDDNNRERLVCYYLHINGGGDFGPRGQGIAEFDDAANMLVPLRSIDNNAPIHLTSYPFHVTEHGKPMIYFEGDAAMPLGRVPAKIDDLAVPAQYEAYTCLAPGAEFDKTNTKLDRDSTGKLIYGWKRGTGILTSQQEAELIHDGLMKPDEAISELYGVDNGEDIVSHSGSVYWNPYRKRWIMIALQEWGAQGTSSLGEVWYSEADTPIGPWAYAKKIITHDRYSFYLPAQHPIFDQDGGRVIYLEGSYSASFSRDGDETPRYDYNQIMYGLSLNDPRLTLPEPVYLLKNGSETTYAMREQIAPKNRWSDIRAIAFYAVPITRAHAGMIPIYADGSSLSRQSASATDVPLFYALATDANMDKDAIKNLVPLYESTDTQSGRKYLQADTSGYWLNTNRADTPAYFVWRNPSIELPIDSQAVPVLDAKGRPD
jgi:hypothetical protein